MAHHQKLPKYTAERGWRGGDSHTLYSFRDKRTGHVVVRPGNTRGADPAFRRLSGSFKGVGPEVDVNVATRGEAEEHWQHPLHAGWKVREEYEIGSETEHYKDLLRRVTRTHYFTDEQAAVLTSAIARAYKHKKISDEERQLLNAGVDARRG